MMIGCFINDDFESFFNQINQIVVFIDVHVSVIHDDVISDQQQAHCAEYRIVGVHTVGSNANS